MDPTLKAFVSDYLGVVASALLPVILTAFVSMPLNLGGHPGEPRDYASVEQRHLS